MKKGKVGVQNSALSTHFFSLSHGRKKLYIRGITLEVKNAIAWFFQIGSPVSPFSPSLLAAGTWGVSTEEQIGDCIWLSLKNCWCSWLFWLEYQWENEKIGGDVWQGNETETEGKSAFPRASYCVLRCAPVLRCTSVFLLPLSEPSGAFHTHCVSASCPVLSPGLIRCYLAVEPSHLLAKNHALAILRICHGPPKPSDHNKRTTRARAVWLFPYIRLFHSGFSWAQSFINRFSGKCPFASLLYMSFSSCSVLIF